MSVAESHSEVGTCGAETGLTSVDCDFDMYENCHLWSESSCSVTLCWAHLDNYTCATVVVRCNIHECCVETIIGHCTMPEVLTSWYPIAESDKTRCFELGG